MRLRTLILAAGLFLVPAAAGAGSLDDISHRDKLFDLTGKGKTLLAVGYPGLVLRSVDAGTSWQVVDAQSQDALFAVDINQRGEAIIVGRSGLVLTSTDAGLTWKKQNAGIESHLFAVDLTDTGKAWAVGHFGAIIFSDDGGATWQEQAYDAELPAVEGQEGGSQALSANEEENEGAIEEARLNVVRMADDRQGWIAGEFGLILHTADGGKTWKRQRAAAGKLLFDLRVIDANHALAAGAEGTLMETVDGGQTWTMVPTGTTGHLLGLWPQAAQLFLVGTDGLMMVRRSAAGGFETLDSGLYTWLNRALFLDARNGFAVGGRGFMLRTTDGGKTWQRLSGR